MDSRQFLAGSFAGCVGQCVGHPLDSIKVVMQTATSSNTIRQQRAALSAYQSAVEMYKSPYGLRSFFRGLSLPLMTKAVEQSVGFGIKGTVGNLLLSLKSNEDNEGWSIDDSVLAGISGSVAGACTAMLLTPVYLVKVQLQATTTIATVSSTTSSASLARRSGW